MSEPTTDAPVTWRELPGATPYVTTSGFIFDAKGDYPILQRSDKVRSAPNVWSLPSGRHECGKTLQEQFITEVEEELGIRIDPAFDPIYLGYYENINVSEGLHWVIHIFAVCALDPLSAIVNKEPDKHDVIEVVNGTVLRDRPWAWSYSEGNRVETRPTPVWEQKEFHPRMSEWCHKQIFCIHAAQVAAMAYFARQRIEDPKPAA